MSQSKIIVVEENVSLEPYLSADSLSFEAQLEKMGFEVSEEKQPLKLSLIHI